MIVRICANFVEIREKSHYGNVFWQRRLRDNDACAVEDILVRILSAASKEFNVCIVYFRCARLLPSCRYYGVMIFEKVIGPK